MGLQVHKGEVKIQAWHYPPKQVSEMGMPKFLLLFGALTQSFCLQYKAFYSNDLVQILLFLFKIIIQQNVPFSKNDFEC